MAEKRRASTRNLREPAAKRRATLLTSSSRSTPTKETPSTRPEEKLEARLPSKVEDNQPLPTRPVGFVASKADTLQSIAESGVLTASLLRSRNAWLNEGLFEKFYSKPVKKKKGEHESLNNPPTRCMTKVGTCQIVIEPHVLEATLFTIREWRTEMTAPPPPQPVVKPMTPAGVATPGVPSSALNSFTVNPPSSATSSKPMVKTEGASPAVMSRGPVSSTPSQQMSSSNVDQSVTSATPIRYQPAQPLQAGQSTHNSPSTQHPSQAQRPIQTTAQPPPPLRPAPAPPTPAQDPVIQMLAQRASIDPILKALMKVVASGTANQDQLREFQRHIDELNAIVARQRLSMSSGYNNYSDSTQNMYSAQPGTPSTARLPPLGGTPLYQRTPSGFGTSTPSLQKPAKPPPAPPQPVIGLAMEFTGSNGDRYLFPKYSILEFAPEAKCIIASFLVVRGLKDTPSSSTATTTTTAPTASTTTTTKPSSTTKKPSIPTTPIKTELVDPAAPPTPTNPSSSGGPLYHQPVTMRITADNAKVFEQISRTVSSLDDARRHMEEVMATTKRAEEVVLALRLPAASDGEESAGSRPGTPGDAALIRRRSMAGAGVLASPGDGGGRRKKAKVEEEDLCNYCFSPVPAGDALGGRVAGAVVCAVCAGLLRKHGVVNAAIRAGLGEVRRKAKGPMVLMLGEEVR